MAVSPINFVEPGKRPASSMSPTIMVDDLGKVKMVIGACGGSKIMAAASFVSLHVRACEFCYIWFGDLYNVL